MGKQGVGKQGTGGRATGTRRLGLAPQFDDTNARGRFNALAPFFWLFFKPVDRTTATTRLPFAVCRPSLNSQGQLAGFSRRLFPGDIRRRVLAAAVKSCDFGDAAGVAATLKGGL